MQHTHYSSLAYKKADLFLFFVAQMHKEDSFVFEVNSINRLFLICTLSHKYFKK
jgi:hypothetical protein